MAHNRWALILGLAFVLRAIVAFVFLGGMPQVSDARSYVECASSLLTAFPGPAYYWPPGNSFALAAVFAVTGAGPVAERSLMIAFSVAGVAFTARLAQLVDVQKCEGGRAGRSEVVTGLIAALYMPAVLLVAQSYSQHLAALSLVALAYFALRAVRGGARPYYVAAGIAFGVGTLTRPSMVSVAPVLLLLWAQTAWRGHARAGSAALGRVLLCGALFLLPAVAMVAPVVLHNRAQGAGATISTNNERNFFLGNNRYTPNYKTSHLGQRATADLEPQVRGYLESFYARPDARNAMMAEAISYITHHPLNTAYRTWNRFISFWGFDYVASRAIASDRKLGNKGLVPLLLVEAGSYLVVMGLALVALVALKDDSDAFVRRFLVMLALAYEFPYVVAFSGGTYHFPVIGLLLPFAGIALSRMQHAGVRAALNRKGLLVCGVLLAFTLIQVQYAYYAVVMKG